MKITSKFSEKDTIYLYFENEECVGWRNTINIKNPDKEDFENLYLVKLDEKVKGKQLEEIKFSDVNILAKIE